MGKDFDKEEKPSVAQRQWAKIPVKAVQMAPMSDETIAFLDETANDPDTTSRRDGTNIILSIKAGKGITADLAVFFQENKMLYAEEIAPAVPPEHLDTHHYTFSDPVSTSKLAVAGFHFPGSEQARYQENQLQIQELERLRRKPAL